MDVARRDEANLRVLRRFVPGIKDICDQASHAACYRFNFENGAWVFRDSLRSGFYINKRVVF